MENEAKKELEEKIYDIIHERGGNIRAYKGLMFDIWKYLRHMLGFMTSNLVMERVLRAASEKFPDFNIDMTKDGPNIEDINDSIQNIEALKFCINYAIDIMEKLAGDVLLKGLLRRLNHKKIPDEIL